MCVHVYRSAEFLLSVSRLNHVINSPQMKIVLQHMGIVPQQDKIGVRAFIEAVSSSVNLKFLENEGQAQSCSFMNINKDNHNIQTNANVNDISNDNTGNKNDDNVDNNLIMSMNNQNDGNSNNNVSTNNGIGKSPEKVIVVLDPTQQTIDTNPNQSGNESDNTNLNDQSQFQAQIQGQQSEDEQGQQGQDEQAAQK